MKQIYTILVCLCMLASFVACEKDKEFVLTTLSVTGEVLAPTSEAATIQCKLSADATISEAYVHYSLTSSFEGYEEVKMTLVNENYSALLLNLADNTTYYIRYEVSNKYSQVMSKSVNSFTTLEGTENGYGYVDLGLSVKWATCNVGANSPEEYGDYFAWGETQPKEVYDWSTYKYCNGSSDSLTKYCTNSSYGTVDNKTTLELSDDAARANWGGSWRMPTTAEQDELCHNCTWTWTTQNGVKGYKVTSKSNGNSIFLPAAGYRDVSSLSYAGGGFYWSSLLYTNNPNDAWDVSFGSDNVGGRNLCHRYNGQSVRPVLGESEEEVTDPTVTTAAITQITETSAVAGGNVTSDGNASVIERGVVYSTNPNPVITNLYNTIKPCGSGIGSFTCDLTNLQPNTTYYVRAYATNSMGTAYGEEVSFTTKKESNTPSNGTENGHDYVDLGLSVKWATCNVGANSPEEYGDYFAWGETEPKSTYNESTYKWCNGSITTLTKYNTDSSYGTVDNKPTLERSDDAARANWGGSWRMHTEAELTELREQCTWTWTSKNGVNGYKVTSQSNGNSIFLPAAGYRYGSSLSLAGSYGEYWSSSLNTDYPDGACELYFHSGYAGMSSHHRYNGKSVRPVLGENEEEVTDPTVTTAAITQITETTAVAGGNVMYDGNASVTERGVVYSTNPNPVITNLYHTIKPCGSGTGLFTCDLTNLQPNTTYYVRAYATNSMGTAYGEEVSFTTGTGTENGYGYVDLGLSVKWATCNVGADTPEEYGDYFAWGETEPKNKYDWSTYKHCNGSSRTLTKYNYSSSDGTVDNKTTLEMSDDAARANWGGNWRMPTDAELTELREQCTWIWTSQNGVYGCKVTSKKNGNSIFLPAAGYRYSSSPNYSAGSEGFYWSSSLNMDYPDYAWCVRFFSGDGGRYDYFRQNGYSVRPVCQ